MKKYLMFVVFFAAFIGIFSIGVSSINEVHDLKYIGSFFGTAELCIGKLTVNIALENKGDSGEEVYAHIYSKKLGVDDFSSVISVNKGSMGNIILSENIEKEKFLSGFYGMNIEIYDNGRVRSYPEEFFFKGCVNDEKAEVIQQDFVSEIEFVGQEIAEKSTPLSFLTLLVFILGVLVVIFAFIFIITSYLLI